MAFKAFIHSPSQEKMQELYKTLAQFRAEKTIKYITAMGITYDTLREVLEQEKVHNVVSKVS